MTIVIVEGLFGSMGTWLYRGLIARHWTFLKHAKIVRVGWIGGAFKVDGPCIVVDHSFGCSRGHKIAEFNKAKKLIHLDPRKPLLGIGCPAAPKGVPTVCIYQSRAMQGWECEGAENILLTDGTGHTAVPAHELAWKALREALYEK